MKEPERDRDKGKKFRKEIIPETEKKFHHLYGPVPSRRLGYSLGVDLLPFKTCSLSCVYCQLGHTPKTVIRRGNFFSEKQILKEIEEFLKSGARVDVITFSGSGEPTLNKSLGRLIRKIKKLTDIPVAVLTNSTLISRPEIRKELASADIVVPSLDAATQGVFKRINRPHPSLRADKIINGLIRFRRQFKGRLWLEILLVKGLNDSPAHLKKLKEAADRINPDHIQLNTVVRPPAEKLAQPLSLEEMNRIKKLFGEKAEVVANFRKEEQKRKPADISQAILSIVRRRPVSIEDLEHSLGLTREELGLQIRKLLEQRQIKVIRHLEQDYFEPA